MKLSLWNLLAFSDKEHNPAFLGSPAQDPKIVLDALLAWVFFCFFFFFFFFPLHLRHAEVPGPGIEPVPQL